METGKQEFENEREKLAKRSLEMWILGCRKAAVNGRKVGMLILVDNNSETKRQDIRKRKTGIQKNGGKSSETGIQIKQEF